jgi:hypothetical protein
MSHIYDILWITAKGPEWVACAPDVETAEAKIRKRFKDKPGRYMIFNLLTREKYFIEPKSK